MRGSGVEEVAYGTSEGVTGSEGGGGRLMRVGACDMVGRVCVAVWACLKCRWARYTMRFQARI